MEKLTKTCSDGTHRAADNLPCGENSWDYKALLLERLGIYEDTGLEPGEVQYLKNKSVPRMVRWTPAYQSYYSAGDEAECYCPVCDSDVVEDDFCPTCGQALKYHDEPEN